MPKGGPRANSGGKRPGAGRKLPKSVESFRAYWRGYFESKEGRAYLAERAKKSDAILGILLRLVYPQPVAISGDADGPPLSVRLVVSSVGIPLDE